MWQVKAKWATESVRSLAVGIWVDKAWDRLPVLADAMEEAGCDNAGCLTAMRDVDFMANVGPHRANTVAAVELLAAPDAVAKLEEMELDDHTRGFRHTLFALTGVNGRVFSVKQLMAGITRKRPRGSGSKRELADRLEQLLIELGNRRWRQATKGQRKPTARQNADLMARVQAAVDAANGRARERTLDADDVIRVADKAVRDGAAGVDGGRVTANSYGYRWYTTSASARRLADGTVVVHVARDGGGDTVSAPASWWKALAHQPASV